MCSTQWAPSQGKPRNRREGGSDAGVGAERQATIDVHHRNVRRQAAKDRVDLQCLCCRVQRHDRGSRSGRRDGDR